MPTYSFCKSLNAGSVSIMPKACVSITLVLMTFHEMFLNLCNYYSTEITQANEFMIFTPFFTYDEISIIFSHIQLKPNMCYHLLFTKHTV